MAGKENKSRTIVGGGELMGQRRIGNIRVAVWKNGDNISIQLQKGYKKPGDTEWTNLSLTVFPNELEHITTLLDVAAEKVKEITPETAAMDTM